MSANSFATRCLRAVALVVVVAASGGCYELGIPIDDVIDSIASRGVVVADATAERDAITANGRGIGNKMATKVPLPMYLHSVALDGVITDVHTCGGGPTQARRVAQQKAIGFRKGDPKHLASAVVEVDADIVINIAQHVFAIHTYESTDVEVARIAAILADISGD